MTKEHWDSRVVPFCPHQARHLPRPAPSAQSSKVQLQLAAKSHSQHLSQLSKCKV